jgi:hypothetical protein
VLRIRIRDPGWVKNQDPDFRDLRNIFFGLKYLNSLMQIRNPGSGMEKFGSENLDPDWKKLGSGIDIPDLQHFLYP